MKKEMKEMRAPDGSLYYVLEDENLLDVYADGASRVSFGLPNTKVYFHTVEDVNREAGTETRKEVLRLTIPTVVFLELSINMLTGFAANKDAISTGFSEQQKKMMEFLERIVPPKSETR